MPLKLDGTGFINSGLSRSKVANECRVQCLELCSECYRLFKSLCLDMTSLIKQKSPCLMLKKGWVARQFKIASRSCRTQYFHLWAVVCTSFVLVLLIVLLQVMLQALAMRHKCKAERVPESMPQRANKRAQIITELYKRTPEQYSSAWGAGVSGPQQSVVGNFL